MVKQEQVLLEPAMRNTAPCILYASLKIKKQNPDAVMVVAPSDHWIEDEKSFTDNLQHCFDFCSKENAFGLKEEAKAIRAVVNKSLEEGIVTEDLAVKGAKSYKTSEVGDWLVANL